MPNTFDSVAFMDNLVDGGFTEKQSKALASALIHLVDSHLVTKDYLDMRLAQLKNEIFAVMLVQTVAILGAVRLMLV